MTSCASTLLEPRDWMGKTFVGAWRAGEGPSHAITEPATSEVLGELGVATPGTVAESARLATLAQVQWAALPYEARADVFRKVVQVAHANKDELISWLIRESGSTRPKATSEWTSTVRVLNEAASLPSRSFGEVLPSGRGRLSMAVRRPLGVVAVISPFNFPLYLAMRAVAPALALGNAVLLKPDLRTAVCGGVAIARLFELAGLPAGLLHLLPGDHKVGEAMTADPNVAMIQFTGSTAVGRRVGEAAGRHLKKVSLELGGKNSLIVLDDADLDVALSNAAWGSFLHQGQICMATGRILVHRSLYARFVEGLAAKARGLPVGDPARGDVALGPLISEGQRKHVADALKAATEAGAKLVAGGECDGLFFQPTVLSDVAPENPIFDTEVFGPVAAVIPFDTDDEAVAMANRGEYGLSMGIISANVGRAMKMGEELRTGMLHINDQTVNDEGINPFGGLGASGNRTSVGGPANFEEYTQWQWITVKGEAAAYPI